MSLSTPLKAKTAVSISLCCGVSDRLSLQWLTRDGDVPSTVYFKNIQKAGIPERRPHIFIYVKFNEGPLRNIYLPPYHAGILRPIYEHGGLLRNFLTAAEIPQLPEHYQLDVMVMADAGHAILIVKEYGQDLKDMVKFRLKELCLRRIESMCIDLPLTRPAVQRYCASMKMLGFFFGGILPEYEN